MMKQMVDCVRCHTLFNAAAGTDFLPPSALTSICPRCCREMKKNHRRADRFNRQNFSDSSLSGTSGGSAPAKINQGKCVLPISAGGVCVCSFCGEEVKKHNTPCPCCGSFIK